MDDHGVGDEGDADRGEGRADRPRKSRRGGNFFRRHHEAEHRHPDDVHRSDGKHHEHHGPAAADAIEALVHAEAKGFVRLVRPVREEERQGLLAPKPR